MATTSKLSFRARNLDATKSMPVYCADELPDLAECTPINRAVAQMPTGMEKDEENQSVVNGRGQGSIGYPKINTAIEGEGRIIGQDVAVGKIEELISYSLL
uniref:Uncharacterized protein n=1 Tax=Loa loa TaxID=7209 RepID=A0A1I7VXU1_LOALO